MNRYAPSIFFSSIFITLFLFFSPMSAFAQAGCCSSHGGVAGCNKSSNHMTCKDGTTSPTCACDGSTVKPAKAKKAAAAAPAAAADTSASETKAEKAAAAKQAKADKTAKAKQAKEEKAAKAKEEKASKTGCCSGHGGVGKCNKSAGFQMCKDGTQSTTCACGKK